MTPKAAFGQTMRTIRLQTNGEKWQWKHDDGTAASPEFATLEDARNHFKTSVVQHVKRIIGTGNDN